MKHRSLIIAASLAAALGITTSAPADPAPVCPLAALVPQRAESSPTADIGAFVAFASTAGASHVGRVSFLPLDHAAASDTGYRVLYLYDADAMGQPSGGPLFVGTTMTAASGGTGDWFAGTPAFVVSIDRDLPAGHALVAMWEAGGVGAPLPAGAWRVE